MIDFKTATLALTLAAFAAPAAAHDDLKLPVYAAKEVRREAKTAEKLAPSPEHLAAVVAAKQAVTDAKNDYRGAVKSARGND